MYEILISAPSTGGDKGEGGMLRVSDLEIELFSPDEQ